MKFEISQTFETKVHKSLFWDEVEIGDILVKPESESEYWPQLNLLDKIYLINNAYFQNQVHFNPLVKLITVRALIIFRNSEIPMT